MGAAEAMRSLQNAALGAPRWALLGPLGYVLLVALLRNRRLRQIQKEFNYPTRASMSKMMDDEAWDILMKLGSLEFPFMNFTAIQFALFRTYGIPTISKLLVKTTQFSKQATSMKRYADTSVLIAEFMLHKPSSLRAHEGLARMNYIHSGYRTSGKILDDDMLYTLSLFALEPVRWIQRYEWRKLTDLEKCAFGTFWKSVGDAMLISFEKLPSHEKNGGSGFRDGLQWFEEIDAWSTAYEQAHMVPDTNNKLTADETVALLLWSVPKPLHPLGKQIVAFMMDDRLRTAMMYPKPSWFIRTIMATLLSLRKYSLRYLALPRPYFLRFERLTPDGNEKGPHFLQEYEAAPYYIKPTLYNRWGPGAWITWLRGLPLPGDEGDKYFPKGYHITNVGPKAFDGKGQSYIHQTKERLQKDRNGSCPFAVVK